MPLDGKKTYIVAVVSSLVTAASAFGYLTPEQLAAVQELLAVAFAGTVGHKVYRSTRSS